MRRRNWTDEEIEYLGYVAGKQSYETIARILHRSVHSVKYKVYDLGLQEKRVPNRRNWTEEEIEYLRNSYRKKSAKSIARKLGRSIASVKHAAERYSTYDSSIEDGLSLRIVADAFDCDLNVVKRWIRSYGLPSKRRKIGKGVYYTIYGDEFWEWALEHKDLVPINNYKRSSILPEPVEIYDKDSWYHRPEKHRRKITKSEISLIQNMKKSGLSYQEIAERVGRTVESVKHILRDNKI